MGGTRSCGSDCQWTGCDRQTCAGPTEQACGRCGTQQRACNETTGTQSDWGACSGEGVCAPNTTQACEDGERRFAAPACQWGPARRRYSLAQGRAPRKARFAMVFASTSKLTRRIAAHAPTSAQSEKACQAGSCICPSGSHDCGGCKSNDSIDSCGASCSPCVPPVGGTVSCNGTACIEACPTAGFAVCRHTCVNLKSADNDCGACGVVCGAGKVCQQGACVCGPTGECTPGETKSCSTGGSQLCQPTCHWNVCYEAPSAIATSRQKPLLVTANSTYVYWKEVSSFSDSVFRLPVAGGTPTSVASVSSFSGFAVDAASNLYVSQGSSCSVGGTSSNNSGYLASRSATGLTQWSSARLSNPAAVAIDSTYVYWLEFGDFTCHWDQNNYWFWDRWSHNQTSAVWRASLSGVGLAYNLGSAPDIGSSFYDAGSIAVNADYLAWTGAQGLHGTNAYRTGGYAAPWVVPMTRADVVALDASNVYWSDSLGGVVMQMAPGGGDAITIASGQTPWGVAADGLNVYWVNRGTFANAYSDGAVMKAPVGGGLATTIAASVVNASGYLALEGTHVYWTVQGTSANNWNDGAIWMASK